MHDQTKSNLPFKLLVAAAPTESEITTFFRITDLNSSVADVLEVS